MYDIVFLCLLAGGLLIWRKRLSRNGQLFRIFLMCYLAYRFGVEFLKPTWKPYLGFSAIQLACVLGGIACVLSEYVLAKPAQLVGADDGTAAAHYS